MSFITSVLTGGSHSHQTTSEEANGFITDFVSSGIPSTPVNTAGVSPSTGDWAVNAQGSPNMTLAISPGVIYIQATPTGQGSQMLRIRNTASVNQTINANATGGTRYDWIYVAVNATNAANPALAGDDVASIVVSRSTSNTTDNGGSNPAFGKLIAIVTVVNAAASISNGSITDSRLQSSINSGVVGAVDGWIPSNEIWTYGANNGQKEQTVTIVGDKSAKYSAGMFMKLTRSITAPNQCTDLESTSSQYFTKATPAGMAQTDDITGMAWIKLESYNASPLIVKRTGTNGWDIRVGTDGTVRIHGLIDGSNYKLYNTYQSLPLNKWVHVAATMDMSANLATFYFNGVSVPYTTTAVGTANSLTNATSLFIGRDSSGGEFFDGKIAQVGIFSAVLTAATIRSYMNQGLIGTEPNLVSGYSFNNSIADLNTTNANNLTPGGSAVATNVDSPFHDIEYGIITNVSYVNPTTTLTIFTGTDYSIPNMALSTPYYSTQRQPFGFPRNKDKWAVQTQYRILETIGISAINQWFASNFKLLLPIGAWSVKYEGALAQASSVSGLRSFFAAFESAAPTNGIYNTLESQSRVYAASAAFQLTHVSRTFPKTTTTQETLVLYGSIDAATGSEDWRAYASQDPIIATADCAYL